MSATCCRTACSREHGALQNRSSSEREWTPGNAIYKVNCVMATVLSCIFCKPSIVPVVHAECSDTLPVSFIWHQHKQWQCGRHCTAATWKMKPYTQHNTAMVHSHSTDNHLSFVLFSTLCIIMFGFLISLLLQFPFVCIVCSLLIKVLYLQGHEQGGQCVCVRACEECNAISLAFCL